MKVYVSEKDIEENELLNTDEYDLVITKYREDFWEEEVYPEIKSLEQHDKELLQEFVKKLKSDMPYWDYGGEDDDPSFYKRRGFQDCHRIFVNILEKLLK